MLEPTPRTARQPPVMEAAETLVALQLDDSSREMLVVMEQRLAVTGQRPVVTQELSQPTQRTHLCH